MREIKFRAWDKEMKCVIYMDNPHWSLMAGENGFHIYNLQNGSGGDEYELMQFTGLLDKNGKEVFEGDIVKDIYFPLFVREEAEYSKVGLIVIDNFEKLGIKWEIDERKFIDLPEDLKKNKFCQPYRRNWEHPTNKKWLQDFDNIYRMEVIGNIYENPELIK